MFGSAKYRNYKYGGDDHIAVVHTEHLPSGAVKFLTAAIHKASYTGEFHYGRNFYAKDADALNIQLPIKDKLPDYEFMDSFITELEEEHIMKLETYLCTYNFKDFTLTDEEKQVFEKFKKDKVTLKEFEIQDLFEVSPSKAYTMNDGDILSEYGKTPYVSNQSQNNGYIGWSDLAPLNPSNVITLSDTWQSERTIFYQPNEFIGKSHLQVMNAYDPKFQKFELFFAISSFRKAILEMNYDYGTKFNRDKIKTTKIQLPIVDNQIDFALMKTFISAIHKLVIKDMVLYVGKNIENTKKDL